jgi:hypothetical protein
MTRRFAITERELVLFHQGALPLREILPYLRDEPLAQPDGRSPRKGRGWYDSPEPDSDPSKTHN